ncbi:MAG: T9SS type A sorting domain-containing protein [Bacteroidota bacterium]
MLQNTIVPVLDSVNIPRNVLDCDYPTVILKPYSQTPNITYKWAYQVNGLGSIQNLTSNTIAVGTNSLAVTNSIALSGTLTLIDNSNLCEMNSTLQIYQNLFPPLARIFSSGSTIRACLTPSMVLNTVSSTGIPTNTIFTTSLPVIGYLWKAPAPWPNQSLLSFYNAKAPGVYTLTAKDLNNGCKADTIFIVDDCLGIKSILDSRKIQIYPSPSHEFLIFEFESSEVMAYTIFDSFGKKMLEGTLSANQKVGVSALPKGFYFVMLNHHDLVFQSIRFIKD